MIKLSLSARCLTLTLFGARIAKFGLKKLETSLYGTLQCNAYFDILNRLGVITSVTERQTADILVTNTALNLTVLSKSNVYQQNENKFSYPNITTSASTVILTCRSRTGSFISELVLHTHIYTVSYTHLTLPTIYSV